MGSANVDTLVRAKSLKGNSNASPPNATMESIHFLFNNLSQNNLDKKAQELMNLVQDEFWPSVAEYLVMKRIASEVNFHFLYFSFLETIKHSEFNKCVSKETLESIIILLRQDRGSIHSSDKTTLKNLGHWLGLLTLAKNKPILFKDINFKSLLIEAYHRGLNELQYVVPFVTKVFEACAKSKVFRLSNPWIKAILSVLAEIRAVPEMKLHLKFEIEVLCKKLSVPLDEVKPSTILQETSLSSLRQHQLCGANHYSSSPKRFQS